MAKTLSGKYWVTWANVHATNSTSLDDLDPKFREHLDDFIAALEEAGATVKVTATRRDAKRAYLFHWSWLIYLGRSRPKAATSRVGVDIEWDHGDLAKSKAGAKEMVTGFGLALPPKSKVAPALQSNHIAGKAVDMHITWDGKIAIKKKDGHEVNVSFMEDVNANTKLHQVGASYGVHKLTTDAPHWSVNGF